MQAVQLPDKYSAAMQSESMPYKHGVCNKFSFNYYQKVTYILCTISLATIFLFSSKLILPMLPLKEAAQCTQFPHTSLLMQAERLLISASATI